MEKMGIQFDSFFRLSASTFLILCVVLSWINSTQATCSKPALGSNSYTLSEEKASYTVNETYEIFCVPGYVREGDSELTCKSTGSWSPGPPTCSPSEGAYPWWMLLVVVTCIILLVACILPRIIRCFMGKKKKKKQQHTEADNTGREEEFGYEPEFDHRPDSPVPKYKKSMNNMEYMAKLYKDQDGGNIKRATKNATF